MTIKRIQIIPPGNNYGDVMHPETDSQMVLMESGQTLKDAFQIGGPYGTTAGTGAAYTVAASPPLTALVGGSLVVVKMHTDNTGPATINVNGLGAKTIKKGSGADVAAGSLKTGSIYTLRYNGTNFILQGEGGDELSYLERSGVVKSGTGNIKVGDHVNIRATGEIEKSLDGNISQAYVAATTVTYNRGPQDQDTCEISNGVWLIATVNAGVTSVTFHLADTRAAGLGHTSTMSIGSAPYSGTVLRLTKIAEGLAVAAWIEFGVYKCAAVSVSGTTISVFSIFTVASKTMNGFNPQIVPYNLGGKKVLFVYGESSTTTAVKIGQIQSDDTTISFGAEVIVPNFPVGEYGSNNINPPFKVGTNSYVVTVIGSNKLGAFIVTASGNTAIVTSPTILSTGSTAAYPSSLLAVVRTDVENQFAAWCSFWTESAVQTSIKYYLFTVVNGVIITGNEVLYDAGPTTRFGNSRASIVQMSNNSYIYVTRDAATNIAYAIMTCSGGTFTKPPLVILVATNNTPMYGPRMSVGFDKITIASFASNNSMHYHVVNKERPNAIAKTAGAQGDTIVVLPIGPIPEIE